MSKDLGGCLVGSYLTYLVCPILSAAPFKLSRGFVAGVWCDAQHAPQQTSLLSFPSCAEVPIDIKALDSEADAVYSLLVSAVFW